MLYLNTKVLTGSKTVGVEGACSSVGDCWKGLGIRSTLKCLWNLEAGWSLKNAEGVRGQSWKNSEMFLEWKTGRPLTDIGWDLGVDIDLGASLDLGININRYTHTYSHKTYPSLYLFLQQGNK